MLPRFLRHLILWLFLSVPIAVGAGAGFSAYFGEGAHLDRFTAAGNGVIAGLWLGSIGAVGAAATIAIAYDRLKQARASLFTTGAIVSYGLIVIGILMLWLAE